MENKNDIKKVVEELSEYINSPKPPVELTSEKKYEGTIHEFDINPAQIFKDEYNLHKVYSEKGLQLLEKVATYIELYQHEHQICSRPIDIIGEDEYFNRQQYYDKVSDNKRKVGRFPFVKFFFSEHGMHDYFHGYDHVLNRDKNKEVFDILFCLKMSHVPSEHLYDFLNYHTKHIQTSINYLGYLKLLITDYQKIIAKDIFIEKIELYKKFYIPVSNSFKVLNESNNDLSKKLAKILKGYFPHNSIHELENIFSIKKANQKLIFEENSSTFYYLFIQLRNMEYIRVNQTELKNWIVDNFRFQSSKEKGLTDFKPHSVKKGLNPNNKIPKTVIDLSLLK